MMIRNYAKQKREAELALSVKEVAKIERDKAVADKTVEMQERINEAKAESKRKNDLRRAQKEVDSATLGLTIGG